MLRDRNLEHKANHLSCVLATARPHNRVFLSIFILYVMLSSRTKILAMVGPNGPTTPLSRGGPRRYASRSVIKSAAFRASLSTFSSTRGDSRRSSSQ
jgi:hypothetical protein